MKWISTIFLSLVILLTVPTTSYASTKNMDIDEFCIGGITLSNSLNYVEQIYGKPTSKKPFKRFEGSGVIYNYNNLFIVSGLYTRSGDTWIDYITIKEATLSTPSGFAVGKPFSLVVNKYGKSSAFSKKMVQQLKLSPKYTYYEYRNKAYYMLFTVDKKGIIQEITCYWID